MGITIKELSELSGYSTATISRVISNSGKVKEETRRAVEDLLIKYNYRTNMMELRQSKINHNMVMVIVGDLENCYYTEIIRNIDRILNEKGYIMILAYSDNRVEKEEQYLRVAIGDNYAGVIFINVHGDEQLKHMLTENKYPVVFVNRGIKMAYFNTVCNDNYHGAYQATKYLIDMGHRKIGHLMGSSFSPTAIERRNGFEEAMVECGLLVTSKTVYQGNYDWETGYAYGEHIIKRGLDFTAVFSGSYQMTEGLLDCMRVYGVKVPEGLSIVSFDETRSMEREKVTTICAEPGKMANSTVSLLLSSIKDRDVEARRIYHEPVMIVRKSVRKIEGMGG